MDISNGPTKTASDEMMVATNVTKSYGDVVVLKEINMSVTRGSVHCIMGPSGSGKSTFLRCINNLETIDSGSIVVNSEAIGIEKIRGKFFRASAKLAAKQRQKIGMVFQHFNLFPHKTAIQNIVEGPIQVNRVRPQKAKEKALDLLAKVGLTDKGDHYPSQLSGGQQQRVAIARMLAMEPELLLFDEPTSALDPELVNDVLEVIKQLAREGLSMIVVTHEMGFAREVADTVTFMDKGQIIEEGVPKVLFGSPKHERTSRFISQIL